MPTLLVPNAALKGLGGQCSGDSGGPLIVRGKTAADDVQIGIVSWSDKLDVEDGEEDLSCKKLPGVLTDVARVRDWIDASIRILTQPLTGSGEDRAACCPACRHGFASTPPYGGSTQAFMGCPAASAPCCQRRMISAALASPAGLALGPPREVWCLQLLCSDG